jgi:putative transposase
LDVVAREANVSVAKLTEWRDLLWVRTFKTIEELRAELVAFARRYNETWLVARHGYKTPARVREEQTTPRIAIDPTLAATLPLAA